MACVILSLWALAFYYAHFCVRLGPTTAGTSATATASSPWWVVALTFAALTHLYAGLFVTAHDAIHGAVCRRHRWLNDLLGTACITCYAFFSFRALHNEHWRHHHWTGRSRERAALAGAAAAANGGAEKYEEENEQYDPDYPPNDDARLLPWFAAFMRHYSTPGQYLRTGGAVALLMLLGAPYSNLCLYMCASAVLAAFQLFYWGTYRPHRPDAAALKAHAKQVRKEGGAGAAAKSAAVMPWPRARSAPYPLPLLFAQAYFFNLHYEHHRWPSCPWWDLPRVRREAREVVRVVAEELEAEGAEPY
jgi:beta-carotene ketolase (CrtW type)